MKWREIAQGVAVMQYPLRAFGIDFQRNVTLLRLPDGRLVIHSTAPFEFEDVKAIRRFGEPAWLVDATLMHDTFAKAARLAFPGLSYFAPADFAKANGATTQPLSALPRDWDGEIDVLRIEGLRKVEEHAFFHRVSRTLILADLFFHFPPETRGWPRFFVQRIMRLPRLVGISLFFRLMIRDKRLFAQSMRSLLDWDFERILVAHSEPILQDARSLFRRALCEAGLAPEG